MAGVVSWEIVTARLLQEFDEKVWTLQSKKGFALAATTTTGTDLRKKHKFVERRRCFSYNDVGHISMHCPKKKKQTGRHAPRRVNWKNAEDGSARPAVLLMAKQWSGESSSAVKNEIDNETEGVENSELEDTVLSRVMNGAIRRIPQYDKFILDSGASDHMVWSKEFLSEVNSIPKRSIVCREW